jgi:DNA-directed RNA polymerase specialized sigma24 family protein
MPESSEELQNMRLARLADECNRESQRFFKRESYDPGFCYEIFRRAIMEADEQAWHVVYDQYASLVTSWVYKHASFHASAEQADYFVNRAFDRMWSAITPEKFNQYPDLKALLKYLQMCVHSAIIDQARKTSQVELELEAYEHFNPGTSKSDLEEHVLDALQRRKLWEEIEKRFNNEEESVVFYASFALGQKARQILESYPERFVNVEEIYLIKQNVMARLRRDEVLKNLFEA